LAGQGSQPDDHLTRFVNPSHMSTTSGEPAIRPRPRWGVLHCDEQFCPCFIEASSKEMCDTDRPIVIAPAVARVEPQRCLDLLDRQIGLSRPDAENPSQKPSPREAWI